MRYYLLALLLLLLPGWARAQVLLTGTVRDSLTQRPLPFASVFLANTTLGATTNEQGQFRLERVPAGSYDLVGSYVGYRLGKQHLAVGATAPPPVALRLAPATSQLSEVVVRGRRRRANRPADYQRFVELFLGQTSFSKQCRLTNPKAVLVDYDTQERVLVATAPDFVQVDNQALGYRIKYYDLHLRADFERQTVTFYGQPIFENLVPRNRHQRWQWEANRLAAYQGSRTHFLKSVYDNRVAAEGFLAQKVRIVPNPPFARADSLRRWLLKRPRPAIFSTDEQDSLARWARVPPSLILLYTAPRPIDSLRRVAEDGRVYLRFSHYLQVSYQRELPDPLYLGPPGLPGAAPAPRPRQQVSRLCLLEREAELQPNGHLLNPLAIFDEEYWAFEKMGEFLPLDYLPPPSFHP